MYKETEDGLCYVMKEFPLLHATAKTGKTKYWQIRALSSRNGPYMMPDAYVEVEYWQDNGAHQTARKEAKGKNLGRSNETTHLQQAILEAESQWNKQKDGGYLEEGEEPSNLTLPMLAMDFNKAGHRIKFPCYGQPKLDGVRALFETHTGFWSRKGKKIIPECVAHLKFDFFYGIFDGELMLPAGYTFQQICSAFKKYDPELSPLLEYHVFDIITLRPKPYKERMELLASLFANRQLPTQVKLVEAFEVSDKANASWRLSDLMQSGYEGLMLRNPEGLYEIGQRSADLQKFKEFQDAEYTIVDVTDGVGREKEAAIFICATEAGQTFNVRPRGDYSTRTKWFHDKASLLGKRLTVRYQNLTDDGVPRFPVGIAIRDYE